MDLFLTAVFRWVLATLLLCSIFQKSESAFRLSQKPSSPTVVVLGVNSSDVKLVWQFSDAPSNYIVLFFRQKTGGTPKQISSSKNGNAFIPSNTEEFVASLDAKLTLKNVRKDDEYTYSIFLMDSVPEQKDSHSVSIIVVVPPEITIPPEPRPLLTIGKNYTLTCNASGDPLPKITWTKDGIPAEEFNVTGYKLHLTDVKLKDVGSYRCTAGNGYGVDASNASIVGVKCNECEIKTVGIKVESETWKSALNNRESIEFKTLQANLLSEISKVYTKSPGKELYTVGVVDFRSGSVIAKVEMKFGKSVTDPLKPLEDEIKEGKLGAFRVKRELDLNPIQTVSTDVYLTATIQENCSKRSEVAAKFPEMACQIAFRFGCSSANTMNTRCGSVVLDFMMRFNQTVVVSNVLIVLSDAARQDKFRGFKVNPDSIKQVLTPTDGSESTTKGPEECNCPSNNVLLAVIGVLAFTVLLLIIYIIWLHKKGAVGKQRTYEDERRVCHNETSLEDIDPSLPDSRKLTQPHAEYMDLIEVNKDDRKAQSTPLGADYVPLHPLTRCWEVPRHNVTIEKIIGKGAFGQVAKGTAVGLRGSPETTTVAIKMLKTNASESDKRDLMKELDTMKQLKPHPYVIKLLGCVTESEQLLVLIEYVPFGDLLGYLRKSRGLKDTYYKDPDIKPQTNLTSQQLMKFAWQIADGMSYLSAKSIIHRDLAARNVLVGQKEMCKVTDFGMARDVQQENIYERKTKGRLPVKWTAYEALLYGKYTTKSDVWSYGVLLYEIFTIGGSPYPRMDGRKIANLLQDGYRMPKPQHVDERLYQIMMKCWKNDPDTRPTFTELKNQLKDMETLHKKLIDMKMYDKQLYANVEDLTV